MNKNKKLYETHNYLNHNIASLKVPIREYDMKEAGFSLIQEFKLLPKSKIEQLKKYTKKIRTIEIGKMIEEDAELGRNLMEGFIEARRVFFEENNLENMDILSIKKDAIFVIKKTCSSLKFGKYIEFVPKNRYTSYYYINRCEFYYSSITRQLDVKGISMKNHILLEEIKTLIHYNEVIKDSNMVYRKLQEFRNNYLSYNLPVECYRLMNPDNGYRFQTKKHMKHFFINLDSVLEKDKNELEISYNYIKFIQPLISIMV